MQIDEYPLELYIVHLQKNNIPHYIVFWSELLQPQYHFLSDGLLDTENLEHLIDLRLNLLIQIQI